MVKKKYYTKDTGVKEEHGTIMESGEDVPQIMSDMVNENGVIPVQINPEVAIQTVSKNMYTDPTACIREYVNNEARPCREAVSKGYKDVSVYITVNAISRNIIIEGRNSMGMSLDMFKEVYVVLGRSGNFDGEESGQFGFGRASYLCLSDLMVFETWSRETDEKFGFVGKNGVAFEPIPSKKLSIKQYGTKITMNMRKDVNLLRIIEYIEHVSRFLRVDVFLEIVGNVNDGSEVVVISDNNICVRQVGPVSMTDAVGGDADVHIDNNDYELVASIEHDVESGYDWEYNLIGMPINVSISTGADLIYYQQVLPFCIINIKNERKYMPTSSRDTLTIESIKLLHSKIESDLAECLGKINITCMRDYYKNERMLAHLWNCAVRDLSVVGFNSSVVEFNRLLSKDFKRVRITKKTDGEIQECIEYFRTIVHNSASQDDDNDRIYYMYKMSKSKINAFRKLNPRATVIVPTGSMSDVDVSERLLLRYGIKSVDEYLKSTSVDTESVHVANGGHMLEYEDTLVSDLNTDCTVKLPIDPDMWLCGVSHEMLSSVDFAKDSNVLDGIGYTIGEFCDSASEIIYETSEGDLTGREILDIYSDGLIVWWHETTSKDANLNSGTACAAESAITLSKCKEYSEADIVLKYIRDDEKLKMCRLILAYIERHMRPRDMSKYAVVDNGYDTTAYACEKLERHCYKKPGRDLEMFDVLGDYVKCISDGIMRDAVGIDVDGVWKNVFEISNIMTEIRNIPVRVLYAETINAAENIIIHPNLKTYADSIKNRILDIDKRSDGKSLTEIYITLAQEYDQMFEYCDSDQPDVISHTAFRHLICKYYDNGIGSHSDRVTSILDMILGDKKSPHYISDNIECVKLSSRCHIRFNTYGTNIVLDNDCMLVYIVRKIFPERLIDKIESVTILGDMVTVTL